MNLIWEFVGGRPTMFDWMFLRASTNNWFHVMLGLIAVYAIVSFVLPNSVKAKK